jgi:hypothetical protein
VPPKPLTTFARSRLLGGWLQEQHVSFPYARNNGSLERFSTRLAELCDRTLAACICHRTRQTVPVARLKLTANSTSFCLRGGGKGFRAGPLYFHGCLAYRIRASAVIGTANRGNSSLHDAGDRFERILLFIAQHPCPAAPHSLRRTSRPAILLVMATILLTWELGGGLGHLLNLLPLARGLCQRGHRVFAALRDLSKAAKVFAGLDVSFLQAPHKTRKADRPIDPPRTFTHILHNSGLGDPDELRAMLAAWRNLFDLVRPDLIVFDHSPTALLAARAFPARRALSGNGFLCPVDEYPLRDLRPWLPGDPDRLRQEEDRVLATVNQALATFGQPPLARLAQLYHDVDEHFLATVPELDHYPGRTGAEYWGVWPTSGGKPPVWPEGEGKRIYAYLKPFPALPRLLEFLNEWRCPAIVFVDGIGEDIQRRFESATLHFEREPLDLVEIGRQCDLAILNGGFGTTAAILLAGRPMLLVPIYLEQALLAAAVTRLGAGLVAPPTRPEHLSAALSALLESPNYAVAARAFAARYAGRDPEGQVQKMLLRAEELLS